VNSSAHRIIRTALLPEFGGMGAAFFFAGGQCFAPAWNPEGGKLSGGTPHFLTVRRGGHILWF
jgi:hypothetical protein